MAWGSRAPRMECWDSLVEPEDTMLYLADARRHGRTEELPVTERYIDMAGAAYEHDSFDTHVRLGLLHMHQLHDEARMTAAAKNLGAAVRTRAEVKGLVAHVEKHQKQAWVFNPNSPAKEPQPQEEPQVEEQRPCRRALITAPSILGSSRKTSTVKDRLSSRRQQHQFGTGSAQVGATDIWTQGLRRSSNAASAAEERQRQLQRRQLALDPPQYLQRKPTTARRSTTGSVPESGQGSARRSNSGLSSAAADAANTSTTEDASAFKSVNASASEYGSASAPSTTDSLQPRPPSSAPLTDRAFPHHHHHAACSPEPPDSAASSFRRRQEQQASCSSPLPHVAHSGSGATGGEAVDAGVMVLDDPDGLLMHTEAADAAKETEAASGVGASAGTHGSAGSTPPCPGQSAAADADQEGSVPLPTLSGWAFDVPVCSTEYVSSVLEVGDEASTSTDHKDAPSASRSFSPVPPSSPRVHSSRASQSPAASGSALISSLPDPLPPRPQSGSPVPPVARPPSAGLAPRSDSPLTNRPDPTSASPISLHMSMAGNSAPLPQVSSVPIRILSSAAPLRPSSHQRTRRSSWLGLESKLSSTQPLFTTLDGRPVSRSEARASPSYTPQRRASTTGTSHMDDLSTLPRRPSASSSGAPPPTHLNPAAAGVYHTPIKSRQSVLNVMNLGIMSSPPPTGLRQGSARSTPMQSPMTNRQAGPNPTARMSPARRFTSLGDDAKSVPIKMLSLE